MNSGKRVGAPPPFSWWEGGILGVKLTKTNGNHFFRKSLIYLQERSLNPKKILQAKTFGRNADPLLRRGWAENRSLVSRNRRMGFPDTRSSAGQDNQRKNRRKTGCP